MARNWKLDWDRDSHRDALANLSFEAGMKMFVRVWASVCIGLMGTSVSVAQTQTTERPGAECLDKICAGDVVPKHDPVRETALKVGGRWFVGPSEYFSSGINGASFEWWNHKPLARSAKRPAEAQALAIQGKGYEFSIEIFLESGVLPHGPVGYEFIQLAERSGWISQRKVLRPGLDAIDMKHVIGPTSHAIDRATYFVATDLKGLDGRPPVATCNLADGRNSGGTSFIWKPGIWLGTRWNQKQCADFPEIYAEVMRVMSLLKEQ